MADDKNDQVPMELYSYIPLKRGKVSEHPHWRIGLGSFDLARSKVCFYNRLRVLALASIFIAGCASPNPNSPLPIDRDPCLDEGPAKSEDYNNCLADFEAVLKMAFRSLTDNTYDYPRQMILDESVSEPYQLSDFPDTPLVTYSGIRSISVTEKQALPFKVKITWKYKSKRLIPAPRDDIRMYEMERIILPGLKDKVLGKWACTATGGQQRQWIFYTRNEEAFIAQIKAILAQTGPYPIEVSSSQEPALNVEARDGKGLAEDIPITPKMCLE